jgi:purine-cytosine permease-like protein
LIDVHLFISVIPVSIAGAHRFYDTITNFLGFIGYWSSVYIAIIMVEHLYFRRNDPSLYDVTVWNVPKRLPSGIAAVAAGVLAFGAVVPFMNQTRFTGTIARTTGDIGFEVGFAVSGLLYFLFRWIEIRWRGFF